MDMLMQEMSMTNYLSVNVQLGDDWVRKSGIVMVHNYIYPIVALSVDKNWISHSQTK
jgi:hypothetical protein